MISPLQKVQTLIADLATFQNYVEVVINVFRGKQIIDGVLIKDIYIPAAGSINVNHGLGAKPRGWIVVRKDAYADIYEDESPAPNTIVKLTATAEVTFSIWVF